MIAMDDAFILNTTFLSTFFPPFFSNGRGQKPTLASPPTNCSNPVCRQPLIEIEFKRHFALVCDNIHCDLFRQPQGSREKEPSLESETEGKSKPIWARGLGYQVHNERKKANYRLLRDLGLSCNEVKNNTSDKRTKEIMDKVGLGGIQLILAREKG